MRRIQVVCGLCWREWVELPAYRQHNQRADSYKQICPGTPALVIGLPWTPGDLLTQNAVRRMHYMREAKAKRALGDAARWAIRGRVKHIDFPVHAFLHYQPADKRRRDADGLAVSLKVALDSLVSEGVLPDDNATHVPRSGCHIEPASPGNAAVWISIEPAQMRARTNE